jgi:dTDP-L-rhamnose 4-epimerase
LENGEPPQVFEDGAQMRDFVHVDDVARANVLAVARVLHLPADGFEVVNVCSGRPVSILDVARSLCSGTRTVQLRPEVTGEFRPGDVRHIVASPDRARETLGFVATVLPEQGLRDFANAPLRDA